MRKPKELTLSVTSPNPHAYDGKGSATVRVTQQCVHVRPAYSRVEYTVTLDEMAQMVVWRAAKANAQARRG